MVGLGNPGREYERTRHNAGWMALDALAARHAPGERARTKFGSLAVEARVKGERCLLVKPTGYMNRSGGPTAQWVSFYKVDPARDLLVLVDDVALPCGSIRVRAAGGAGGHNGLADVERAIGSRDYPRLRIGIGSPPPGADQVGYVLGKFTSEQMSELEPALERAADAAEVFAAEGAEAAMNRFNIRAGASGGGWSMPPDASAGGAPGGSANASGDGPGVHPGWLDAPERDTG